MKRALIVALLATTTTVAQADNRWVPAIVGGIVGGVVVNALTQPRIQYVQQYYAVPAPAPVVRGPVCVYPTQPVYVESYAMDQWGRAVLVPQFAGCQ